MTKHWHVAAHNTESGERQLSHEILGESANMAYTEAEAEIAAEELRDSAPECGIQNIEYSITDICQNGDCAGKRRSR